MSSAVTLGASLRLAASSSSSSCLRSAMRAAVLLLSHAAPPPLAISRRAAAVLPLGRRRRLGRRGRRAICKTDPSSRSQGPLSAPATRSGPPGGGPESVKAAKEDDVSRIVNHEAPPAPPRAGGPASPRPPPPVEFRRHRRRPRRPRRRYPHCLRAPPAPPAPAPPPIPPRPRHHLGRPPSAGPAPSLHSCPWGHPPPRQRKTSVRVLAPRSAPTVRAAIDASAHLHQSRLRFFLVGPGAWQPNLREPETDRQLKKTLCLLLESYGPPRVTGTDAVRGLEMSSTEKRPQ